MKIILSAPSKKSILSPVFIDLDHKRWKLDDQGGKGLVDKTKIVDDKLNS